MMTVLGFYTSPRKGGNSDQLLDAFLRGAADAGAEIKSFYSRRLKIHGCLECGGCDKTGECVLHDDMDQLYPLLIEATRVVFAVPVFFYGVPSEGKALIDRSQALWNRNRLDPGLKRPQGKGFFIGVGATKGQNLFDGSILTIRYFLDAIGLPDDMDMLVYRRIEGKGEIERHPTALTEAYEAGKKFVSP